MIDKPIDEDDLWANHMEEQDTATASESTVLPGYVDLTCIQRELTELVGVKFHQFDERLGNDKMPGQYDITKWVDKYRGRQNLPKFTVELNTFRNEVDQFVSMVMAIINRHT